jgi:peptidoglycan/LPS O-acetylase OafA/YrhL
VSLVIIFHFAGHHAVGGGWAGVDVFFVLSGFLITGLLTAEHQATGRIAVGRFLGRRAVRLLPALLFMLSVWVLLLALVHDQSWFGATPARSSSGQPVDPVPAIGGVVAGLLFVSNWDVVFGGMDAPLEHLWSLAVEGQFYLVWPVATLLLLRLRTRRRIIVTACLAVVSASLPFVYWNGGAGAERVYFGTDTRAVELLAGALAAWIWQAGHPRTRLARIAGHVGGWIGLAMLLAIALAPPAQRPKTLFSGVLLALAAGLMILALLEAPRTLTRVMCSRPLLWAGRRSYALYLWNYLLATWTHPLPLPVRLALGVPVTMLLSELSWRLVEGPALLRAKQRRRRSPRRQ